MSGQSEGKGRLRLRTMMRIVAVFSVFMFAGSMLWRRHRYQEAASRHASLERQHQNEGRSWFVESGRVRTLGEPDPHILSAYHARLAEKYRRAASRPWRVVEPDPPNPGP